MIPHRSVRPAVLHDEEIERENLAVLGKAGSQAPGHVGARAALYEDLARAAAARLGASGVVVVTSRRIGELYPVDRPDDSFGHRLAHAPYSAEGAAAIATVDTFNRLGLPMIAWGAVLPDITYRNKYPEIHRVNGTMINQNDANAELISKLGYKTVAVDRKSVV